MGNGCHYPALLTSSFSADWAVFHSFQIVLMGIGDVPGDRVRTGGVSH